MSFPGGYLTWLWDTLSGRNYKDPTVCVKQDSKETYKKGKGKVGPFSLIYFFPEIYYLYLSLLSSLFLVSFSYWNNETPVFIKLHGVYSHCWKHKGILWAEGLRVVPFATPFPGQCSTVPAQLSPCLAYLLLTSTWWLGASHQLNKTVSQLGHETRQVIKTLIQLVHILCLQAIRIGKIVSGDATWILEWLIPMSDTLGLSPIPE